jgi:hypothetical protein
MKKLVLALLLLPVIANANSTSYWEIEHTTAKDEFDMHGVAEKYDINFVIASDSYVFNASYIISETIIDEKEYQVDVSLKKSIGSFYKGSVYAGYGLKFYDKKYSEDIIMRGLEGDDILDTVLLGYAKYNSKGIGFDVVASFEDDGDSSLGLTLRNPIGKNGAGLLLGISSDEVGTSTSFGYSHAF